MRGARAVRTDQQIPTVGARDLGDRIAEDLDVVGRGVRPRSTGPQLRSQELLRVLAPHPQRVEPEGPLERGRRLFLLAVRDHDRGIDIEHDCRAEVGSGDPAGRQAARYLCPDMAAGPGPDGGDLLQPCGRDLGQCAPPRRRGCDRTEHTGLMPEHVDVGDRLTAIGKHHRHVGQDPAAVVNRDERPACHRCREPTPQTNTIGQQAKSDATRVGHHADTIGGNGQTG